MCNISLVVTLLSLISFNYLQLGSSAAWFSGSDGQEDAEAFERNETMSSLNDTLVCPCNEFQCDNGWCVSVLQRCDRNDDCGDYSDERYCGISLLNELCTEYEFQCDSGNCTRIEYKCDGDNDCGDWSDEIHCDGVENATSTTIPSTESVTNISPGIIEEVTETFSTTETTPSLNDTLGLEPSIQSPQEKYRSAFYNVLQYFNFSTSFNRKQLRSLKSENSILHYNNTNLQVEVKELESEIQNVRSENLDITARLSALESTLQHNVTTLVKEQEESDIAALIHTAQTLNLQAALRKLAVNNVLTFPRARLYSGRNFTGESEMYDYGTAKYVGGCHDLVDLKGKVKSVETFEKCVRVFNSNGCAGWSSVIYPASGNSHDILNSKLTEIGSVGPCLHNEFAGAIGSGHPSDKHRVPDLLEFFSIEKYQKRNGTFTLGPHNRVEFVRVTITRKVLPVSVSEANVEANEFYQSLDKEEDDVVGYLYPVGLGGPVDKNWNIFPQSPSGRDAWLRATSEIRPHLERAESKQVSLTTNVLYWNDESTRPYAFTYYINYDKQRISYGFISN